VYTHPKSILRALDTERGKNLVNKAKLIKACLPLKTFQPSPLQINGAARSMTLIIQISEQNGNAVASKGRESYWRVKKASGISISGTDGGCRLFSNQQADVTAASLFFVSGQRSRARVVLIWKCHSDLTTLMSSAQSAVPKIGQRKSKSIIHDAESERERHTMQSELAAAAVCASTVCKIHFIMQTPFAK
jgi:hypothetical protein